MSFNSSQVVVHGHAINNVDGDQYNHTQTVTAQVVYINGQKEMGRNEYDEYEQVKRGHVLTLKRLYTEDRSDRWEWEETLDGEWVRKPTRSTQRTICTVQVRPDQQTKYTAVIYEGKDAHLFWDDDFEHFSRAGLGTPEVWQLYGLNRSKIPLLIFHGELVPLANFYKESFWGDVYLEALKRHLGCFPSEIWLDMGGNLCKGLIGPDVPITLGASFDIVIVPCSAEMLREDTCFNFFQQSSSSHLERPILNLAYFLDRLTYLDDLFPEPTNHHPRSHHTHSHCMADHYCKLVFRNPPHLLTLDTIDGLRFDTVYSPSRGAIARWPSGKAFWEVYELRGLVDQTKMGDGLIRYKLYNQGYVKVSVIARNHFPKSWLMQSSRIIDAHGMSGMEGDCFIVEPPFLRLSARNQESPPSVENLPPIYLFIYPPPLSISELISWKNGRSHFWSLDENGQSEMLNEECNRWGVPDFQMLLISYREPLHYWPTYVYTALHKWQVARGSDPSTADWARSHGYPEFEIIGGKKEEARFEGVRDYGSYLKKLREQDAESRMGTPVQVQETATIPEVDCSCLDDCIQSPEDPSDEQGDLPPPEQNEPSSAQETPKEETESSSWWSWEAVTGSGISACM